MLRSKALLLGLGLSALSLSVSLSSTSQSAAPSIELTGTVKDASGKPMEGVGVSAKAQGATITTSVWTSQSGAYAFPALPAGQYRVWAQAVGFERALVEAAVAPGKAAQRDFTLKTLQHPIDRQLSTAEWLESLPADSSADRRMKMVLLNQCSNCHLPGTFLDKHFDAASWEIIFDKMEKIAPDGDVPEDSSGDPPGRRSGGGKFEEGELDANGAPVSVHTKLMRFYRKDVIEYLTRVAGPKPFTLKPKPFPRPTGVATQLVVTEYDLPRASGGVIGRLDPKTGRVARYVVRDGRTVVEDVPPSDVNDYRSGDDWALGTRDEHEERGTHDLALGTDGNIYYGANAMSSDARGYIWWGGKGFTRLDIKTQAIKNFPRIQVAISHGTDVDTKGYVWGSTGNGTVRMNIETGELTEFNAVTPLARPYDLGVDRMDNVWFTELAADKMGVVDSRTGKVTEVALPPMKSPDIRQEDIDVFNRVGSWDHNSALGQQGPRRMGADRNGDFVYAGLYWAGSIIKLDARTKTLAGVYRVPNGRWVQPYKMIPDKNHMVWFSNAAADLLGKFNPTTNTFVMYPLPTRGTNSRHLGVDDTTDPPTVWVPYTGAGKVARVQFRTNTAKN